MKPLPSGWLPPVTVSRGPGWLVLPVAPVICTAWAAGPPFRPLPVTRYSCWFWASSRKAGWPDTPPRIGTTVSAARSPTPRSWLAELPTGMTLPSWIVPAWKDATDPCNCSATKSPAWGPGSSI